MVSVRNDARESASKNAWVRPEVKKISAGSAEAGPAGVDDGGPLGNARS